MTLDKNKKYLRIPLYKMYYIDDVHCFGGLSVSELSKLIHDYTEQEIEDIMVALKWGKEHPDFDFCSLLPGLKHSNQEVYKFICMMLDQLYPMIARSD